MSNSELATKWRAATIAANTGLLVLSALQIQYQGIYQNAQSEAVKAALMQVGLIDLEGMCSALDDAELMSLPDDLDPVFI